MQPLESTSKARFISKRQRYQKASWPDELSGEELARDWTLSSADIKFLASFNRRYRLLNAIQCQSIRLYGRFLDDIEHLAPKIVTYLAQQLTMPAPLTINVPARAATLLPQGNRLQILTPEEYELLWGFPQFTASDREVFFSLTPREQAVFDRVRTQRTRLHFLLLLGHSKARQRFLIIGLPPVARKGFLPLNRERRTIPLFIKKASCRTRTIGFQTVGVNRLITYRYCTFSGIWAKIT